jgi:hypothetical protein
LLGCNAAQNAFERSIALGVAHDARHFDLMHGVDQRGRRAGLAQDVTYIGYFRDACAFASQPLRDLDAEQPLLTYLGKGLAGKASFRVDRRRVEFRNVGGGTGARRQIVLANADHPGGARHSLRFQ